MSLSQVDPADMSRQQLLDYCYSLEALLEANNYQDATSGLVNLQTFFQLPPTQAKFLAILSEGRVCSKDYLLTKLYPSDADAPGIKIIDVYLCKVRKKVEPHGISIRTIWGTGLQVEQPELLREIMQGPASAEGVAAHG
jgi:DNA-binding winged helix-turn-helix (wHTH) protein